MGNEAFSTYRIAVHFNRKLSSSRVSGNALSFGSRGDRQQTNNLGKYRSGLLGQYNAQSGHFGAGNHDCTNSYDNNANGETHHNPRESDHQTRHLQASCQDHYLALGNARGRLTCIDSPHDISRSCVCCSGR